MARLFSEKKLYWAISSMRGGYVELTLKSLKKLNPCPDGLAWWQATGCITVEDTMARLFSEKKLYWANWLIVRVLTHDNQIRYAIFAARQVLGIYEKQYPDDARPRQAIEVAETYLKDKTEAAAEAAARAATEAAWASGAAWATEAAAEATAEAAAEAARAAWAARAAKMKKIINYGIKLITGGE